MTPKKLLRDEDVLRVATALIKQTTSTTTLDVKNALRDEGFWATQDVISAVMNDYAEAGELVHDFGAPHRTYTLPEPIKKPSLKDRAAGWFNLLKR